MEDYHELRIDRLFNAFMETIQKQADKDAQLSPSEIMAALGEAILCINKVNLEAEEDRQSFSN